MFNVHTDIHRLNIIRSRVKLRDFDLSSNNYTVVPVIVDQHQDPQEWVTMSRCCLHTIGRFEILHVTAPLRFVMLTCKFLYFVIRLFNSL